MMGRPRQHAAYTIVVSALLFSVGYTFHVFNAVTGTTADAGGWAILIIRTAVELIASAYGIAFLVSTIGFLVMRDSPAPRSRRPVIDAPVGIIYLCCNDADWSALESLTRLSYPGRLQLVIHDDSTDPEQRDAVDRMALRLTFMREWDVRVLRRPDRSGGKAGAVNYALEQTAHAYDYFLLCDNDSTVLAPDTIQRALPYLDRQQIGGVQFRSVPVADPAYCRVNQRLSESIGAFHAFLAPAARFGWMPFIGHNALLRTSAVMGVGGLTPDFFSDDLDLTVRLNLAEFRIAYAPEIEMGEKHPPSYTAFRKRSYKWAYGCIQTLRLHWRTVLTAPQFSLAEKVSFLQFAGFYLAQCAFLAYLCLVLIVLPLAGIEQLLPDPYTHLVIGIAIIGLVYLPLFSYYLKSKAHRRRGWWMSVVLCGLVYGATDFSVMRGVADALRGRRRVWVPTNGVTARSVDASLFAEAAFGLALLYIPLLYLPELLYLPAWFLFAGKFLFGPALSLLYRDEPDTALTVGVRDRAVAVLDPDLHPVAD